jgi:glycerol-3-phosphate dehydrogenase subunit C
LLRLNGFAVEVTPDICCGTPTRANGDAEELMNCVRKNVAAMEPSLGDGACVVTACTSCGYALKAEYAHLPSNANGLAAAGKKLAANTYDLGELLAELLDAEQLRTDFRPRTLKLAYHAPCHLKLRVSDVLGSVCFVRCRTSKSKR